ncbi:MAG: choice-of-anchor D domain-containing protein [Gemmatimonadetes bacterium]|nr:choice-of-anchor D domain-containing protein [Gemmatimonadota bacterium]
MSRGARTLAGILATCLVATSPAGATTRGAAPSLRVDPDPVTFPPVAPESLSSVTAWFHNDGGDVLYLGLLEVSDPEFTIGGPSGAPPPGTPIEGGDSLAVDLFHRPASLVPQTGTLTIETNDPATPLRNVVLMGSVLEPPVASVSPDSVAATLAIGDSATVDLTIRNSGQGPLDWTVRVLPVVAGRGSGSLAGAQILWDSPGLTTSWSTLRDDVQARGGVFLENPSSTPITPALLATVQAYVATDQAGTWTEGERAALVDWVRAGGGMLLLGDASAALAPFNALLTDLGTPIRWTPFSANADQVVTSGGISAHPTTQGITRLHLGVGIRELANVDPPSVELVHDSGNASVAAAQTVGVGRLVTLSDEFFDDAGIVEADLVSADNREFGNRVIDWIAGPRWLSASPASGQTGSADSATVALTFAPADLPAGEFDAIVRVVTNDPVSPTLDVPAHLTLTGFPSIGVSPASLQFGPVPVLTPVEQELIVTATGSDTLSVTDITSSSATFTAFPTAFVLAPDETKVVTVVFTPPGLGPFDEALTIESNAEPDSSLSVPVGGVGVVDCDAPCPSPGLRPASIEGGMGYAFWLDLSLDNAPVDVESFGFELVWDPRHLAFRDSTLSDGLAAGFVVDATANEPGRLTCGGFSTNPIPAGSSGSLVRLRFEAICDTCAVGEESEIRVIDPIEDLADVIACCGKFTQADCASGDGDVNGDGILSATDALCALKIYLNSGTVPPDSACDANGECEVESADVNCSGSVTPGDALAIHERVLCVAEPVPLPCFASLDPSPCDEPGPVRARPTLRLHANRAADGLVLEVEAITDMAAFGLELEAEGLALVSWEPGAAAGAWPAVQSAGHPGRIRVGGYGAATTGTLATLTLRGTGPLRVAPADGVALAGDAAFELPGLPPAGLTTVGPSPAVGALAIAWSAARRGVGELSIHDVAGRRVRRLVSGPVDVGPGEARWDGRDDAGRPVAAGLYFVVLRLDESVYTRKAAWLR